MKSSERQDVLASPYRGIHPFRYVDQAYFFGREETVAELLAKVLVSRLVLLFGESGTGKSSLINAGLIPALEKEGLSPERLRVRPIAEEPILIERISMGDEDDGRFPQSIFVEEKPVETDTGSQGVPCSLERFLKTIHETEAYPVLIFDQFEELFTLFAQDRDEAVEEEALQADLLDTIFQIVSNESLKAKVIIVIREDFLGKLEILAKNYPQVFDYRVRLGHLDQSGAGEAILGTFENKNPLPSRLTPELAERIIQDLSNSQPNVQIQPTQLQIICSRLWEEYAPTRSEITVKDFEEMGEIKGIIEGFLKSELAGIKPALRPQAVVILGHLITESGTRDVVSEDKLRGLIAPKKDISGDELSSTLDFLEKRRLVNRTYRRGTYYYEIASEYLIPPIQKEMQQLALEQERAEAERQARAEAEAMAAKIFRRLSLGLAVALLIAALAALVAFQERNAARTAEAKALSQRDIATSRQLAAQAIASLESNPQLSLLLAVEAVGVTHTVESDDALRQALESSRARAILRGHVGTVNALAFSPDGSLLATGGRDGTVRMWDAATGYEVVVPTIGYESEVLAVAFSPDGQWLATGSRDGIVWRREAATGYPVGQTIGRLGDELLAVAFSPDGQWLATGSRDGTAHLWDVFSGEELAVLRGHKEGVNAVALSQDGSRIATASLDGTARLWDRAGKELAVLRGHTSGINTVMFSPDGTLLATASADGTARLWKATNGEGAGVLSGHVDSIVSVAFSSDGPLLATGSADGTARLWDVSGGKEQFVLPGHKDRVNAVAFSPNGQWLATAGADGTTRLWDVSSGGLLTILQGHTSSVNVVVFSPDGTLLATASSDSTARLWAVTGGEAQTALYGQQEWGGLVAFNPDGRLLASGSGDGTVSLWDVTNPAAEPVILRGREPAVIFVGIALGMAFSPDGRLLASGSDDGTVSLWDVTNPAAEPVVLRAHKDAVFGVAFNPDGRLLASGSDDGTVRLWDVTNSAAEPVILRGQSSIFGVAFSPDGRWLASGSGDGTVSLWSMTNPAAEPVILRGHEGPVFGVVFSPDGRWLASGSPNTARLWDVTNPAAEPVVLRGHKDIVFGVAFSPDGRLLATGSQDGTARLWDVSMARKTGGSDAEVAILREREGSVCGVAFSPDGSLLATNGQDGTVRLWTVSPEDLLALACSHATRNLTQDEWETYFGRDMPYRRTCMNLPVHPSAIEALRAQGQEYARQGKINEALAALRQAVELDPSLKLVPEAELARVQGEEYARQGQIDEALAALRQAVELDPALELTPEAEVAELLVEQGRAYAYGGEYDKALATLHQAVELDPTLKLVPEAEVAVVQGQEYARQGQIDEALAALRQAVELDPALELTPEAEVAEVLVEQGRAYAYGGEYDKALATLHQAVELAPTLEAEVAGVLLELGHLYAFSERAYDEALAALHQAVELEPQIELSQAADLAGAYNSVCWWGSLDGQAERVLPACERAVELAPDHGGIRDSRGLARALTGDYAGAIEDFKFFVEWSKKPGSFARNVPWREAWITELEAGRNPFDEATLEKLRSE